MSDRAGALALALVMSLIAAPAVAGGPDAKVEARRHFDAGVADVKQGFYPAALSEFTRAYELSPSYPVLYNIAKCREALGQPVEAGTAFERYLADGGSSIPADRRKSVIAQIKELEARIGTIRLRASPDTARLSLDGAAVDVAAAAKGIRVNPGVHVVAATNGGYSSAREDVKIDRGGAFEVVLTLAPLPPPAPPPIPLHAPASPEVAAVPPPPAPPPVVSRAPPIQQPVSPPPPREPAPGGVQRAIGYSLVAAGAAALAAGGVLYLIARSDQQKAIGAGCNSSACTGQGRTDWQNGTDGITRSRIAAIAGGALVVGGLTLVLIAPSARDAPAGVAIGGRF